MTSDPIRRAATGAAAQPGDRGGQRADLVDGGHRRLGDRPRGRSARSSRRRSSRREPIARIRFATVEHGTASRCSGPGWFGVRARHGRVEGEYPLFMPMTTEQATVGGRETFGEPKKIGAVTDRRRRHHVHARFERMGFTLAEVTGHARRTRSTSRRATRSTSTSSAARRPTARASTASPRSSTCIGTRKRGTGGTIDGTLKLGESPRRPDRRRAGRAGSCRCSWPK